MFDADLEAIGTFNDPQPVRRLRISAGRAGDSNQVEREGSVCKTAAITKKSSGGGAQEALRYGRRC